MFLTSPLYRSGHYAQNPSVSVMAIFRQLWCLRRRVEARLAVDTCLENNQLSQESRQCERWRNEYREHESVPFGKKATHVRPRSLKQETFWEPSVKPERDRSKAN